MSDGSPDSNVLQLCKRIEGAPQVQAIAQYLLDNVSPVFPDFTPDGDATVDSPGQWQVPELLISWTGALPTDRDSVCVDPWSYTIHFTQKKPQNGELPTIQLGSFLCKVTAGASAPYTVIRCDTDGESIGGRTVKAYDPMGMSPNVGDVVTVCGFRHPRTKVAHAYITGVTGGGGGGGDTVKVSADDTTPGYLNGKLVAGNAIGLTETGGGGDETLAVAHDMSALAVKAAPDPAADFVEIWEGGANYKRVATGNLPAGTIPGGGLAYQVLQKDAGLNNVWDYVRAS